MTAIQPDTEELLILAKTYPSPSASHRETTCVAAVNRAGALRRIFPVPFRLLDGDAQFQKWEWIQARVSRPTGDTWACARGNRSGPGCQITGFQPFP